MKLVSCVLLLVSAMFLAQSFAQDLPTGAIARISVDKGPVNAVAYSPDANRFAVAGSENIQLYNGKTFKKLSTLTGHTAPVLTLAFSANGEIFASGSEDKTGRLWNATTGELIHILGEETTGHKGALNALAFSENGEMFYSTSIADRSIRSWNPLDGDHHRTIAPPEKIVKSITKVAFSPHGKTIARASEIAYAVGGKIKYAIFLTETETSNHVASISTKHAGKIVALAVSSAGDFIASGSEDQTIEVWKVTYAVRRVPDVAKPLWTLMGHTGTVTSVAFSASGKMLASGSVDKTIRLWDVTTGEHLHTFTGHTGEIGAVTFAGDEMLVSGSSDGTVFIWDLDTVVSTDRL